MSSHSVVYEERSAQSVKRNDSVHNVSVSSSQSVTDSALKSTVFTQTPTLSKPTLSLCVGPSHCVRPVRPNLAWTKIETFCFLPADMVDLSVLVRPTSTNKSSQAFPCNSSKGTECSDLCLD